MTRTGWAWGLGMMTGWVLVSIGWEVEAWRGLVTVVGVVLMILGGLAWSAPPRRTCPVCGERVLLLYEHLNLRHPRPDVPPFIPPAPGEAEVRFRPLGAEEDYRGR